MAGVPRRASRKLRLQSILQCMAENDVIPAASFQDPLFLSTFVHTWLRPLAILFPDAKKELLRFLTRVESEGFSFTLSPHSTHGAETYQVGTYQALRHKQMLELYQQERAQHDKRMRDLEETAAGAAYRHVRAEDEKVVASQVCPHCYGGGTVQQHRDGGVEFVCDSCSGTGRRSPTYTANVTEDQRRLADDVGREMAGLLRDKPQRPDGAAYAIVSGGSIRQGRGES